MVGTAADGQLSPPFTRAEDADTAAVRFALATSGDDEAIRRLLRDNPLRGDISLSFEREPSYFRGANIAGADDRTIVAYHRDELICMGRCTMRPRWINGTVRRSGYLAELRLDVRAKGRFDVLRGGYRFFHELHRQAPADFYFTSIASDNHRARRLFERGVHGLPRYAFLGELTTLLVSTRSRRPSGAILEPATAHAISEFLRSAGSDSQLASVWSPHDLATLAAHDLRPDDFAVVRRNGRIVACAALWDQRSFRQTVIRDYRRGLALARPWLNAIAWFLRTARLPARGMPLAHACLSPFAFAPGNDALLPGFVAAFAQRAAARRIEFLTLGFPSGDPRILALQKHFHCRSYHSRLYSVTWPGEKFAMLQKRPLMPDIALL